MSDEDALLAAIIADADEDTPRLVYADWLEENGRPERAEFIRLQCRNAARDPDQFDAADEEREAVLEDENRGRWLAGAPQFTDAKWEFRRGFPEHLSIDGEFFLERYDAFARVPWLRSLWLSALSPWDVRDLMTRPWQPRWVELALAMVWSYDLRLRNGLAFATLANSPRLAQLQRLTLFRADLDPECIRALAASPYLDNLRQLSLNDVRADRGEDALIDPLRERFGNRLVVE